MTEMTDEQKDFCMRTAQWLERIKSFPGGVKLIADLFQEIISANGLTVVDAADPKVGLRREIMQELYDALWTTRELRQGGYTLQTAERIGVGDLYRTHGTTALQRYLKITTDNALHNAGLEGFSRSETRETVN